MTRDDVLVVMGHNGSPKFEEMSTLASGYVKSHGYPCAVFQMDKYTKFPFHMKSEIIQLAFDSQVSKWVVWMDVDSFMVNPIDELFEEDYDIGVPVKEKGAKRSNKHGSYLYAGFSIWKVGENAQWILDRYSEHNYSCDQKELHEIVRPYIPLDDEIFDKAGQIFNTEKFDMKLFDQDVYFHMDAIKDMRKWEDNIKILHFKGKHLKKMYARYRDKFLC